MNLSLKKIQQMNNDEIFSNILPELDSLFQQFYYIGISEQEHYKIVKEEISASKESYNGDIPYLKFLKERITKSLSKEIEKLLSDSNTSFSFLNRYIDQKFINIQNSKNSLECFYELDDFLSKYHFLLSLDVIMELIRKNEKFEHMVELVFENYRLPILSGNLEKIFDNSSIISIIEAYCMLNNLEITNEMESCNFSNEVVVESMKIYLNEISKTPLLSAEEERDLAIKIAKGDSEAKEKFIKSNLRLVVSVAKKYFNKGMDLLDLIQEGNLGLMEAIDRFDVSKGYKFSSYAFWWIRQYIGVAIVTKGESIRIPKDLYAKKKSYLKAVNILELKLNRYPTIEEIANEMNISTSKVIELQKLQNNNILSIDEEISEDNDSFGEFISNYDNMPEDITVSGILPQEINELLKKCHLKEKEIKILMLRYGYGEQEPITLSEIAEEFSLSLQRISQIEIEALMKIRNSKYIKDFAIYMDYPEEALENIEKFRMSKKRYPKKI